TNINVHGGDVNNKDLYAGNVGNDNLTDNAGDSGFWGDGGSDHINVGGGGNTVHFGAIDVGGDARGQIITNDEDHAFTGFWNVSNNANGLPHEVLINASTSADITTITGFNVASDHLDFNSWAWAGGGGGVGSIVHADGTSIGAGNAVTETVTVHDQTLAN